MSDFRKSSFTPLLSALITVVVILGISSFFIASEQSRLSGKARSAARQNLNAYRSRLESKLNSRLYMVKSIAAYVSTRPDISGEEFRSLVSEMVMNDPIIGSVALSKNSVISHIYPLEGHEAALGLDLMSHPERREMVQQMIRSRIGYVQGPVELVEGGIGFISYTPIFLAESKDQARYWGLSDVVIMMDPLFKEAGLSEEISGLQFALKGKDGKGAKGEFFWGSESVLTSNPVIQSVTLPNGTWQISAIPKEGWPDNYLQLGLMSLLSLLVALLGGGLTFVVMLEPVRLVEEIDERKKVESDLRASEEELVRYRKDLENLVAERTESLIRLNEELREEVSHRKQKEGEFHLLSTRMMTAQEGERKRLSAELHDGLGQSLLSIKMKAQIIQKESATSKYETLIDDLSETISELRNISMAIRPSHLEESDIDDIFIWHGNRFMDRTGLSIKIDADSIKDISIDIKENLFRIFQETLSNIAKHSGANTVKVMLKKGSDKIRLSISDNGTGFTIGEQGEIREGIGLFTMRERALHMRGDFAVDSSPGQGTSIVVEVPF